MVNVMAIDFVSFIYGVAVMAVIWAFVDSVRRSNNQKPPRVGW